jgi:hypothetical protein
MEDQVEVSSLSCKVILSEDSTSIRPVTERPSLFPPSFSRTPIGSSCDSLSSYEGEYGVTTFRYRADGRFRGYLFADGLVVCERGAANPDTHHIPFGSSLSASLACFR